MGKTSRQRHLIAPLAPLALIALILPVLLSAQALPQDDPSSKKTAGLVDLEKAPTRSARGPLRIHPKNPRYFTDGSGKAIYLTGSHTWSNLQDQGAKDRPPGFDYDRYLDFLQRYHHNFIRMWAWEQARWAPWSDGKGKNPSDWFIEPNSYARTGPGLARDGKPKFDLSKFDPVYFHRLRERVRKAGERGIYVSVMLFQGWSSTKGWYGGRPWLGHPYHPDNNVQRFNGNRKSDVGPDLNDPQVRRRQAVYMRKVVDTLHDLDNVLYEVTNEGGTKDWDWWVVRTVQEYERTKAKQHPVGLTGHGSESNEDMLAGPATWISPGSEGWPDLKTGPRPAPGTKVSLLDTDHVFGVGGDQKWVWKGFLRGHNVLFMDPYDDPQWTPILEAQGVGVRDAEAPRRAMGHARRCAERMNLAESTPRPELASTGYCLADPGREYLVYLPDGGEVKVDLSGANGRFSVEWMHAITGKITSGTGLGGGGWRTLKTPFAGDAVLYMRTAAHTALAAPQDPPIRLHPENPHDFLWRGMPTVLVASTGHGGAADPASPAAAEYLRCESRVDPLGIGEVRPRLSWEMHDTRRGAAQTAYRILVATTSEKLAVGAADLWDSGKIASNRTTQIVYEGRALASRTTCHWKVRLWDADGRPTPFSQPAMWSIGLLNPADVQGRWIGMKGSSVSPSKGGKVGLDGCDWVWYPEPGRNGRTGVPQGTRFFRGTFALPEARTVARARALIAADDRFELYINGKPAGAGGGFQQAQPLELTHHLLPGKNVVAVAVVNATESPAGLLGKVVVEFDRGPAIEKVVDAGWKAGDKSDAGWNSPQFDDAAWHNAVVVAKRGEQPWGRVELKNADVLGCPLVRKEFKLDKPVRKATLYASALGTFLLRINGRRVGRDYFSPGWTDYRKRVYYNTYDVTKLVRGEAANAIGGIVGAGWYAGAIGWKSDRSNYGIDPRLFAQLEIEAPDGSVTTIAGDGSWKTAWGPYVEGEFLYGETYDARRELPGWDQPGYDDSSWSSAADDALPDTVKFQSQPSVLVEETGCLKPVKIVPQKPGVFVVDMGRNFAGVARLKVRGPAGTRVTMRFAERLNPDGSIYTTNLRGARATDVYILKGQGDEIYQPAFTFHGFQYVEVSGYPGKLGDDAIAGVALNSATPLVGAFECSSPMVNKLYSNVVWTQRANFLSIPTDCPQRDERLGWTGDAQVFVRAATYNADVASFFTKWMVDLEDSQRADGALPDVVPYVLGLGYGTAAWADAGTIVPSTIHHVYDDRRLLEKHYGMMARWVEYCRKNSKGLIRPAEGYGDWLSINAETPKDLLATAYFAFSTKLVADAAKSLGKDEEAKKYAALFDDVRAAFNRAFVAADGRLKGNTQTGYVLAIYFDLLSREHRDAAARHLVDDIRSRGTHLSTGFNGTGVLMPVLAQTGHQAVAYKLLLNETYPSWGYSIKHGATSIWERWDGWTAEKGFQDPAMNSFAHYSFGAVARWMFQSVAGIDTDTPGYRRLSLRPMPGHGLSRVRASYRSPCGKIESSWSTEGGRLVVELTVPANTTATVAIPARGSAGITEGSGPASEAVGVKLLREEPAAVIYEVKAGKYRFATP